MAVALWRSRVVPRWYPPVLVAGLVLMGAGGGRVLDMLEAAQILPLAILARYLWSGDFSDSSARTRQAE